MRTDESARRHEARELVDLLEDAGALFYLNEFGDFRCDLDPVEFIKTEQQAADIAGRLFGLADDVTCVLLARVDAVTVH